MTNIWKRFYTLLLGFKRSYVILYITKLLVVLLSAIMPLVLLTFVDEVLYHHNLNSILPLVLLYLTLFIMKMLFSACDIIIWQYLSNYLVISVKNTLWKKILNLKLEVFHKYEYADLVNIINDDSRVFVRLINQNIFPFINAVTSAIISLCMVFYINIYIGLLVLVVIPCIVLFNRRWTRKLKDLSWNSRSKKIETTSLLLETISSLRDVKLLAAEKFFGERLEKNIHEQTTLENTLTAGTNVANERVTLLNTISKTLVLLIVALASFQGAMTIGGYIAITQYILQIHAAFSTIFNFNFQIKQRKVNLTKIFSLLDEVEESLEKGNNIEISNGDVAFQDVSFGYNDTNILNSISFRVRRGDVTGLIGRNGTGKSTIISLLAGLYEPNSGLITIDNQNINEVSRRSLRSNLCIVIQQEYVDDMEICDYIRTYNPSLSDSEIFSKLAGYPFCDFITNEAYIKDMRIGSLSAGQAQRIKIAASFMNEAPILIMDEPTSMIDREIEKEIFLHIKKIKNERTIIIVSHGEHYLDYYDHVIDLDVLQ